MAKIFVEVQIIKTIELEATDEEIKLIREGNQNTTQKFIDDYIEKLDTTPEEWTGTVFTTEDGEEIYDLG